MTFKVGDKVRCINSKYSWLEFNKIYTVFKVNFEYLYLDPEKKEGWDKSRFVLVKRDNVKFDKEQDYYKWLANRE